MDFGLYEIDGVKYTHEKVREVFRWGSYGKNFEKPEPSYKFLKDISNDHLLNIINWLIQYPHAYPEQTLTMMSNELRFRTANCIIVDDYN